MKKYRNKAFRFNQDIDNAYRRLFGTEPVGCVICGEDEPELLDIHEADDSHEFKVLCRRCCDEMTGNDCFSPARYNTTQDGATL